MLRNYKIRKLLDPTLVSSSERFRDALEGSQRLGRKAGEAWPADTEPPEGFSLMSLRHVLSLKTDGEFPTNEDYILRSVLPIQAT